jgi:hypothetical protein
MLRTPQCSRPWDVLKARAVAAYPGLTDALAECGKIFDEEGLNRGWSLPELLANIQQSDAFDNVGLSVRYACHLVDLAFAAKLSLKDIQDTWDTPYIRNSLDYVERILNCILERREPLSWIRELN